MSAHARNTDPGTSHESARITELTTLPSEVKLVAAAVRAAGGYGATRGEVQDGRLWRRFSDAEHKGLIVATRRTRRNPGTGRNQTVYVTPEIAAPRQLTVFEIGEVCRDRR